MRVMRSSLIPAVQDALRGLVGERLVVPQHCQEVIAEGSMLHAELRREHHSEWMDVEITCSEEIASKGAAIGRRCDRALWRVEREDRRERPAVARQSGDSVDEVENLNPSLLDQLKAAVSSLMEYINPSENTME